MKIVYEHGAFKVAQLERYACSPCLAGWNSGTLATPADGGPVCTHGRGRWQVGQLGPRGGWYPMSPAYGSPDAAEIVCNALVTASRIPAVGI